MNVVTNTRGFNEHDARRFYKFLAHKNQTEIRAIRPKWLAASAQFLDAKDNVISIFVKNEEEFIAEVQKLNGLYNVYAGLNERKEWCKDDSDVKEITNIGHDIDAHGSGPSKDEGLVLAGQTAIQIRDDCVARGMKEPMILNSGRGYWVIHHVVPIHNTEENIRKIKEFGKKIKEKYTNDQNKNITDIDSTVYNPSRIARVPGTLNISEENKENNYSLCMIMNNPPGEPDEELNKAIIEIEIPKPATIALPSFLGGGGIVTDGIGKFMDYCLTHQVPEGERNKVISKNIAIYLASNPNRELLREQYVKIQGMNPSDIDGWLKKIDEEPGKFSYNIGELVNFTKRYKIPFDWRNTIEYQDWKKYKKSEELIEKAIEIEKKVESFKTTTQLFANKKEIKLQVLEYMKDNLIGFATEILVTEIKKNVKIYTWRDDNAPEIWVYIDGKYTNNGETIIREYLRQILDEEYSSFFINKVIEKLRADTYIDPKKFIDECLNHEREINVKNGIIKIEEVPSNLPGMPVTYEIKLLPHSPDIKFLSQVDVVYDPNATCPAIDKFLEETLAQQDDRDTAYEVIGVGLDPSLITKKAVIAYGPKDTGKSTFLNMVQLFYGKDNCCNLTLHQLTEDHFSISNLFGKMANIAADLSSEEVKNIGVFKSLTGGDQQEGDRKFKTHIGFRNLAKFYFGCNELPRIYNADEAFWGRLIAFNFVRKFVDKVEYDKMEEADKKNFGIMNIDTLKDITTRQELSGLLNKALQGLIRYYKNKKFTYSRGVKEIMDHWIRHSDSFMAFCMDNIETGDMNEDYIIKKDLAKKYYRYCKKHNVRSISEKGIKATLNASYGVFTEDTKRYFNVNGESVAERIWEGIKWKVSPTL